MTDRLITYAQNFEDVMLNRAFGNIDDGFYIDVGANDPEAESVTKLFYDRGWSGINIEPTDSMFARLKDLRPRDVNIHEAAWKTTGTSTLYLIDTIEAFATLEPEMAKLHVAAGRSFTTVPIETVTLSDLCERHVGDRTIHFMKVDVEGGELQVLQGHDFTRWRPKIVLIEAHGPDFIAQHYKPAEDLLLAAGYVFAYVDGLNRFYIAKEHHKELVFAFRAPPNVYDNWMRVSERDAIARAEFAERTRAEAWAQLELAQRKVAELSKRKRFLGVF